MHGNTQIKTHVGRDELDIVLFAEFTKGERVNERLVSVKSANMDNIDAFDPVGFNEADQVLQPWALTGSFCP